MILAPFATLPCDSSTDCVAVGDGTIAFTSSKGTLVFVDSDGVLVDELEMPAPGMTTGRLRAAGDGAVVGCANFYERPCGVLLARRGESVVKRWQTDINQPHVQAVAGVGALVSGDDELYLLRWDLTANAIPVPRESLTGFEGPYWWNHDVLMTTAHVPLSMEEGDSDHEYHCISGDGVVRFGGQGEKAIPVDDELALVWNRHALHVIDRTGARLDTLARGTLIADMRHSFARVGGDVVVKIDMYDASPGLLRITPRTLSKPVWEAPFPADNARVSQNWPVRVGRYIAINLYGYGPAGQHGIFLVDAETGAHVSTLKCDECAHGGALVPVADNVVATDTVFGRKDHTDVWSDIDTSSPRRRKILHEGKLHHAMCSPKPGVLACALDDAVCLYRVA